MRAPASLLAFALLLAGSACSDATGSSGAGGGTGGDAATGGEGGEGGASGDGGASSAETTSVTSANAGGGNTSSTSSSSTGATTSSTGGGDDPYATERQICVDTINALRATEGLPPYARWTEQELCSDEAATSDEMTGQPHGSFGSCGESAQNECLGHGPSGIEQCLNQMWAEKDLPECTGCSACHESQGNCPDCVFNVCGHYVNMSALYFGQVACGYSSLGGWDVQNFR